MRFWITFLLLAALVMSIISWIERNHADLAKYIGWARASRAIPQSSEKQTH